MDTILGAKQTEMRSHNLQHYPIKIHKNIISAKNVSHIKKLGDVDSCNISIIHIFL
jgi:hypothetical protein